MWGFAHVLRSVGDDMGFAMVVMWACGALYLAALVADVEGLRTGGMSPRPELEEPVLFGQAGPAVYQTGRWWTV
jgi:hypothetical protein